MQGGEGVARGNGEGCETHRISRMHVIKSKIRFLTSFASTQNRISESRTQPGKEKTVSKMTVMFSWVSCQSAPRMFQLFMPITSNLWFSSCHGRAIATVKVQAVLAGGTALS
jgi:hypothetical protein